MDFNEIFDNIKFFFADTKKKILFICGILVLMTLCALVVLTCSTNKKESKREVSEQRKINPEETLLIPSGPAVPDEYVTSRKTEESWSVEDVEKWFTVPDEGEVNKLGESNDSIVNEILGAAP